MRPSHPDPRDNDSSFAVLLSEFIEEIIFAPLEGALVKGEEKNDEHKIESGVNQTQALQRHGDGRFHCRLVRQKREA